LRAAAITKLNDCYSLVAGLGRPTIDVGGGGCAVSISGWKEGLILAGTDNVADEVTVSMAMGRLQLDATNTDGVISVRGSCNFEDLSAGSTVNTDALITNQVWDTDVDSWKATAVGSWITKKLLTVTKFLSLK
jgi:hypothetical protein